MDTLRITEPLDELGAWTNAFREAEIPVLSDTVDAVEAMRANEDDVDANLIGETVSGDPLMTLRVLAYASAHRPARLITQPETVTAAVVMMGISPFFRAFGPLPSVEERLADQPVALEGLRLVLRRAHRAANFALGFAVHRMDPDAAVIQHAALLHDFAEMLLWCHAPGLAVQIRHAQLVDPTLRSSSVQRQVLNIALSDLQQSLMQAWRLPEMLARITDGRRAQHPSARSVELAIRLARHTAHTWDNAAVPDDIHDIGLLLNLSDVATRAMLLELDT